jgi:hypothetical protein
MLEELLSNASICFLAAGAAGVNGASVLNAPSIHLHTPAAGHTTGLVLMQMATET